MAFAEGGPAALEAMTEQGFDVVVTDMKMPGMDGAELLSRVRERSPQTIRLVLSGHAEQGSIMRVLDQSHQYLSKPCDPEVLKATIDRAVQLRRLLEGDELRALVSRMGSLPSIPRLYDGVMAELGKPQPSVRRVAGIIESDMSMTAKILKVVNSAFFGLRRSVGNVDQAVGFLGLETISALVLSAGIFKRFEGVDLPGFSPDALWAHGNRTPAFARVIAVAATADKAVVAQAFTAGLIHDIGRLALASQAPKQYGEVLTRLCEQGGVRAGEVETELLGATSAQVGAYLLGLWGLPDTVVEAVAHHEAPTGWVGSGFGVVGIVHVAHALAEAPAACDAAPEAHGVDPSFLDRAGVANRWPEWIEACRALSA